MASIVLIGCGTLATKGKLPNVNLPELPGKKRSLGYRFVVRSLMPGDHGVILRADEKFDRQLNEILHAYGGFNAVKEYPGIDHVSLGGKNIGPDEEVALRIKFPVETDYFMDIVATIPDPGPHGYMELGLLHIITLGFIPIVINNDVDLQVTLYERSGKQIFTDTAKDESTIWCWSPLILFNGFNVIGDPVEAAKPIRENAFKNLLSKIPTSTLGVSD